MTFIHSNEAHARAIELVRLHIASAKDIEKALLVTDLFGRLRLVLWTSQEAFDAARTVLHDKLIKSCGLWWTGEMLLIPGTDKSASLWNDVWDDAWKEARPDVIITRLRYLSRHRSRTGWFTYSNEPLWKAPPGPAIVVFYSFGGGLGRSTALASFAIQRARVGERVAVVDLDLNAPSVGTLLSADSNGSISPWGVVDYLLERPYGDVPLANYYHGCARVSNSVEIKVFPAGTLDDSYVEKLARIDLEEFSMPDKSAILQLFIEIREKLSPHWILLDVGAGVSELAGRLLSGIAHLHVLFGTTSEQSWRGLRIVLDRFGRQRLLKGKPQAEVLLVQTMVPAAFESGQMSMTMFAERARKEFTDYYYAANEINEPEDDQWSVGDLDCTDAPHVPVSLPYQIALAHFRDIEMVADTLHKGAYLTLGDRITARFRTEEN